MKPRDSDPCLRSIWSMVALHINFVTCTLLHPLRVNASVYAIISVLPKQIQRHDGRVWFRWGLQPYQSIWIPSHSHIKEYLYWRLVGPTYLSMLGRTLCNACMHAVYHIICYSYSMGPEIYGSKQTRVGGQSPRTRSVYVAINPWQPCYNYCKLYPIWLVHSAARVPTLP